LFFVHLYTIYFFPFFFFSSLNTQLARAMPRNDYHRRLVFSRLRPLIDTTRNALYIHISIYMNAVQCVATVSFYLQYGNKQYIYIFFPLCVCLVFLPWEEYILYYTCIDKWDDALSCTWIIGVPEFVSNRNVFV